MFKNILIFSDSSTKKNGLLTSVLAITHDTFTLSRAVTICFHRKNLKFECLFAISDMCNVASLGNTTFLRLSFSTLLIHVNVANTKQEYLSGSSILCYKIQENNCIVICSLFYCTVLSLSISRWTWCMAFLYRNPVETDNYTHIYGVIAFLENAA
jgi:hypothetical protein